MGKDYDPTFIAKFRYGLRFCQVDNWVIRDPRISVYGKVVYTALCGYVTLGTINSRPGLKTLAEQLGISKPRVIKAIAELETIGLIEVKRETDDYNRDKPNVYIINDWRSTESVVDSHYEDQLAGGTQIYPRVNLTSGGGKSQQYSRVNHVDRKEKDLERDDLKDIDRAFAQSQKTPLQGNLPNTQPADKHDEDIATPTKVDDPACDDRDSPEHHKANGRAKLTKPTPLKQEKDPPDPRVRSITDRVQAIYGSRYLGWGAQVRIIKTLLTIYTEDQIVECWKAKWEEKGKVEFVSFSLLLYCIADFVKNGNCLPDRRANGYNGYRKTQRTADLAGVAEIEWLESGRNGGGP